jgi:hypothetical protein
MGSLSTFPLQQEKGNLEVISCPAATSLAPLYLRPPFGRGGWMGDAELPSGVYIGL